MVADSGFWKGMNPTMTITSLVMVLLFLGYTLWNAEQANLVFTDIKNWIQNVLGWYYVAFVSFILFFGGWIMCSRYGSIRLGNDDERPSFSNFSWFSMLLSAGVGIGILFWSIAEPMYHLQGTPITEMAGVSPNSEAAAQVALRISIFHWGLHGWALFVIAGLIMSYFAFRKKLPLTVRSTLYPLLGKRVFGQAGHMIDLLAIFCTLFGLATTLGLAAKQMNSGLNYLLDMHVSTTNQVLLIGGLSLIATLSTVSGIERGMRKLSEWNIRLSTVLVLVFLFAGPTVYLLGSFVTNLGDYMANFVALGLWTDTNPGRDWQGSWTIFYWGWWISWTPFVGLFIARISRGRTIREFVLGGCVAPVIASFFWISVLGGTAVHMELFGDGGVIEVVNQDLTFALFRTIELLQMDWLTWYVAALTTILIITWFVTSADSGTHVICTLLSMGNEHPPRKFRMIWGMGAGLIASVLLVAGGLGALQAASIAAALPFSLVMVLMCFSLAKDLKLEYEKCTPSGGRQ